MFISRENDVVTLINVFDVQPERQQELIKLWVDFTEDVKGEPGLIGTALHRSKDGTRVINYAQWKSDADFEGFLRRYGQRFATFGAISERVDPHTYEVVYLFERER